jgi:hypothetical protein
MKLQRNHLTKRILGVAVATAALITPAIASAQAAPSYADNGSDQQIQGTVASINGTWNISVADANGYTDSVELRQGTIINPTGLTLEPGMNVTIDGYADGSNFDALEIDTPYQYDGPAPVAVYYGPGAWYPGYADGWGPSFSLFFDIGSNRFERRSFVVGGEVRRPMAPPDGWQNRPHGYIGARGNVRVGFAAQGRTFSAPQQRFAQPQQRFAQPQQQQRFAQPAQQQRFAQPAQQQRFAQPAQQQRFAQPAQQQRFAQPAQQQRFAQPQQRAAFAPASRPAPSAASRGGDRGGNRGGDQHR